MTKVFLFEQPHRPLNDWQKLHWQTGLRLDAGEDVYLFRHVWWAIALAQDPQIHTMRAEFTGSVVPGRAYDSAPLLIRALADRLRQRSWECSNLIDEDTLHTALAVLIDIMDRFESGAPARARHGIDAPENLKFHNPVLYAAFIELKRACHDVFPSSHGFTEPADDIEDHGAGLAL